MIVWYAALIAVGVAACSMAIREMMCGHYRRLRDLEREIDGMIDLLREGG